MSTIFICDRSSRRAGAWKNLYSSARLFYYEVIKVTILSARKRVKSVRRTKRSTMVPLDIEPRKLYWFVIAERFPGSAFSSDLGVKTFFSCKVSSDSQTTDFPPCRCLLYHLRELFGVSQMVFMLVWLVIDLSIFCRRGA